MMAICSQSLLGHHKDGVIAEFSTEGGTSDRMGRVRLPGIHVLMQWFHGSGALSETCPVVLLSTQFSIILSRQCNIAQFFSLR